MMFGTIKELEKEIEQFQNNMAASGEITSLLQQTLEQIKNQNVAFDTEVNALLTKIASLPDIVENANASSNEIIRKSIETELQETLDDFTKEQNKYIATLEKVKQQIQGQSELSEKCVKHVAESADRILAKTEAIPNQICKDNQEMQRTLVADIDHTLESRNAQFSAEQNHFVEKMEIATEKMEKCKNELISKYQEFIKTLENTNFAKMHEENQQLKTDLNKRTIVLTIMSAVSIVVGIIGLFF